MLVITKTHCWSFANFPYSFLEKSCPDTISAGSPGQSHLSDYTINNKITYKPLIRKYPFCPCPFPSSYIYRGSHLSLLSLSRETERDMLGVFSSAVVTPPEELVAAGCRTPSPKMKAKALLDRFLEVTPSAVSVQIGSEGYFAYSHHNESPLRPR